MRGGNYSSASSYAEYVAGPMDAQYSRTFDQSGPYGQVPGNTLIGAQGQGVPSQGPTSAQLNLVQSAGRHRRRHRGGFLGEVVNQAIVPLGLLGLQQTFRRKKGGRRTRKRRH